MDLLSKQLSAVHYSVDEVTDLGRAMRQCHRWEPGVFVAQIEHSTVRSRFGILELSLAVAIPALCIADQRFPGPLELVPLLFLLVRHQPVLRNGIRPAQHCRIPAASLLSDQKWTIFINVELSLDLICFSLRQLCLGLGKLDCWPALLALQPE
jgi:hypothetical protein